MPSLEVFFAASESFASIYPLSRRERVGVRGALPDTNFDVGANPSPCPLPSGERGEFGGANGFLRIGI
jgi:hypothetical protein